MLSTADYIVIAFYFVFMASMGWVFKRFIKDTSDYFRSGGEMLWWIVGASAFMTNFSAVSFTGMAGKAYQDGPVVLVIFFAGAIGFFFNYIYFAPMFRQMRCVTAMDAVRRRFGEVNEQFFTWIQIPLGMLYAAIWLNGLAVFLTAAFGLPQWLTIVATGAVVLVMSLLGGSWTSTASDFVQMLLLMPITVVAAVLALMKIGGLGNFFAQTPSHFWKWNQAAHSNVIGLWIIAMLLQKWIALNNMTDASRYLSVKDTRHARKAALLATILFVIGPGVWFIPPMVARIVYPDLRTVFPDQKNLPNVQDASYFAIGLVTMPVGMIGLLISGIFASTMGQMDSGLNRNAGFFVKNFYQVKLRPHATERELLLTSRLATVVFGALIVLATLWFASFEDMPIFKLMVNFGGWVALPVSIPLIWGMFIRRAPQWSGWSTVLVGLAASYVTYKYLGPTWLNSTFGVTLNARERSDWAQLAGILVNIAVGSSWFLFVALFAPSRRPEDIERVDQFFREMHTPVDFAREEGAGSDNLQAKIMGRLCLIYGSFIMLLVAIPNRLTGRLAFVFCGGAMLAVGYALHRASKGNCASIPIADNGHGNLAQHLPPATTPET